ncbi:hypothetical protein VUR80DRAFT_8944 [Thermomyces stellatus]
MAMFSQDATRITLVGSHLVARMPDDEGRMKDTELDLNDCIGNNNGRLEWDGNHFSDGTSFRLDQGDDGPVLHATLRRDDGEPVESTILLAERIRNEDGNLVFSMFTRRGMWDGRRKKFGGLYL